MTGPAVPADDSDGWLHDLPWRDVLGQVTGGFDDRMVMFFDAERRLRFVAGRGLEAPMEDATSLQAWLRPALGRTDRRMVDRMLATALDGQRGQRRVGDVARGAWEVTATPLTDAGGARRGAALVIENYTDVVKHAEHLTFLAYNDALTGLPNRAAFQQQAQAAANRAARSACHVAMLFLDLDRFKEINDTLGHDAGNELLCVIAGRLKRSVRDVDCVARLSGDEFAILVDGVHDAAEVAAAAARVIAAVAKPHSIAGHEVLPAVSVGAAIASAPVVVNRLLTEADTAMYHAKRGGGDRFAFYDSAQHEALAQQHRIAAELYRALEHDELELRYLPQIELATGAVASMEALVRWRHPERGLLGPDAFLPAAERAGLISSVGDWVFERVADQVNEWDRCGLRGFRVAVNLCNPHVTHGQAGFAGRVQQAIEEGRIGPDRLEMEVTERFLDQDLLVADPMLRAMQARGVDIAIDDFGTGHSSLARLETFPADLLKIDRSLTAKITANDGAIPRSIIALAHHLGMRVTAEGVERPEQLEVLREAGCDFVAGFLFSRPLGAGDIPGWLERR